MESSDPTDPFSFEALEATFARERAEREAAETPHVGRDASRRSGPPPRAPFSSAPQHSEQLESDDIFYYQDEGMPVDARGEARGNHSLGTHSYASQANFLSSSPISHSTFRSPSFPSLSFSSTRAQPPVRSTFDAPPESSSRSFQPGLSVGWPASTSTSGASHWALYPTGGARADRMYAPSSSQARLAAPTTHIPDEVDEFESEFGDGTELRDVDEDRILSTQNVEATTRLGRPQASQAPVIRRPAPQKDKLVPVSALPDRYRSFFKFGVFNAVQSQCFDTTMHSDENLVVSSPTGSGKTVIFELAIIRLLEAGAYGKAVYLAPTKSLCAERARDWTAKFAGIGVKCAEMTSDTAWSPQSYQPLRDARVLICTPEKWDSITRWKSSSKESKLIDSVALLMIDEVHLLREKRGSVLEVVVARMNAIDANVRFIALSATVPNIADVGRWLRPPSSNESTWQNEEADIEQIPSASVFTFGDEYRPCKLTRKIVAYPKKDGTNPFMFVKTLEKKVFDLLEAHGEGKPVLIFCPTRKIVESCAEQLLKDVEQAGERKNRLPFRTTKTLLGSFADKKLQKLSERGIAFHHAGLSIEDRRLVEMSFTQGSIMVVVSTSTLAVGVNLPAHTVVVLGTQGYTSGVGMTDYSDLDIIQMIGRAGRPQFDKTGLALILTAQGQERKFDAVAGGTTVLESSLRENLIEHLNSETALGTITDLASAIGWLRSSFFYIRLLRNPAYYVKSLGAAYKVKEGPAKALERFVKDAFASLGQAGLVEHDDGDDSVLSTGLGEVMSKRYIRFGSMKRILRIPDKVSFRDLLEVLCEAEEFEDVRLRADEKTGYKEMGRSDRMRFPVKEIKTTKDKVLVIIQMVCGGHALADIKVDSQPVMQSLNVFRHAPRIAQTILDVGLLKESGSIVKHGLELLRSMNSKAFETATCIFRILDKIGEKALQVFAQNRITTFAELASDPRRIERLLNRNPPFGTQIVEQVKALPKFTLEVVEHDTRSFDGTAPVEVDLEIIVSAVVGKQHKKKGGQNLTISCLVVTSDMVLIDFRRSAMKNFQTPQSYEVTAALTRPSQVVHVLITCNEIAGINVFANFHAGVDASEYPAPDTRPKGADDGPSDDEFELLADDADLAAVDLDAASFTAPQPPSRQVSKEDDFVKLSNGRYACHHSCKDKSSCAHPCCREGLRNPRRVSRARSGGTAWTGNESAVKTCGDKETTPRKGVKVQPAPRTVVASTELQDDVDQPSSDGGGGDDPLSVVALQRSLLKPKAGKKAAVVSKRPSAVATEKKAASPSFELLERPQVATLSSNDDDGDFPSADRAIDQTLSSGRAKLARIAYRSPSLPIEVVAGRPRPSSTHEQRKSQKRARSPSVGPTDQAPVVEESVVDDAFDDLLGIDLGSGAAPSQTAAVEPLFHPASPTSPAAERLANGTDMRDGDDDLLVDGQLDLDRLLNFGRALPDEAAASAPARKRARQTIFPVDPTARVGQQRQRLSPVVAPSVGSPVFGLLSAGNGASGPATADDNDESLDPAMDTLRWMEQFVVD